MTDMDAGPAIQAFLRMVCEALVRIDKNIEAVTVFRVLELEAALETVGDLIAGHASEYDKVPGLVDKIVQANRTIRTALGMDKGDTDG